MITTVRCLFGMLFCWAAVVEGQAATEVLMPRVAGEWEVMGPEREAAVSAQALQANGRWYRYQVEGSGKRGSGGVVAASVSSDGQTWIRNGIVSAESVADRVARPGSIAFAVENQPGHFYLFRSSLAGPEGHTHVYHSTDPLDFGKPGKNGDAMHLVCELPWAVKTVQNHNGKWRLFVRDEASKKVQSAPLIWEDVTLHSGRSGIGERIRVALFDDAGSFGKGVPRCQELLGTEKDIQVSLVKPALIRGGGLRDFDVVIFTGGSGSRQANTLGLLGREQVRGFIDSGGGYVGICAGNYLACDGFGWGLKVLDAKTKSSKWARGQGQVKIEFTPRGREILGLAEGVQEIRYANGPVFDTAGRADLNDYESLAVFRSELAENGSPVGAMVGSPAMVAGEYGKGRVLCSSPHPEQQDGMETFISRAVRWVAGNGK